MGKKHKKHKSDRRHEDEEKPHLKIVLKLGSEGVYDSDYAVNSPASHTQGDYGEVERSHKKKKKKRRRNSEDTEHYTSLKIKKIEARDQDAEQQDDENDSKIESAEMPSLSIAETLSPADTTSQSSCNNSTFSPVSAMEKSFEQPVLKQKKRRNFSLTAQMRTALEKLLEHLLRQLERKDPHEIFSWPVNDLIAPGYSKVIKRAMDFSTMRNKIELHEYSDISEFKDDFLLMIENCCSYNRPETIFYESGKKLKAAGMKIMSKERMINMKRTLGFLHDLNKAECAQIMGLPAPREDFVDVTAVDVETKPVPDEDQPAKEETSADDLEYDLRSHPDAVSFTDADNEETVAPDVLQAAKLANEKLAKRCPKSKMGFLRIDDVGKTTLNFLNPELTEESNRVVDLGTLTGRLAVGLDALPDAKEDKRNKVTPISYLSYGPFGSFAPSYDSRIANITQEESDLLLAAYGGEVEYQFAQSLHTFVKDSEYDLVGMVDDLLSTLTHGTHKRAIQSIEEKRNQMKLAEAKPNKAQDELERPIKVEKTEETDQTMEITESSTIQDRLNSAGALVVKLEKTQNERLSIKPMPGQSNLVGPSAEENHLASKLQNELSNLISEAKPVEVSSIQGIRKAMGIDLNT